MEDHYEHSKFDIKWEDYQTMFPAEGKSKIVNRMGEIIMIQSLLEEVLKKKQPLILDTFWKNLVSEKQWLGKWEKFRDHYRKTLSKRIESLHFIDSKYRALLMFATSASVTEQFQKELADAYCHCLYDEHRRIIAIRSNDGEIEIKGIHRKMVVTRNRKTKKVEEKEEDDEKDDDDDDEKEEDEDENDEKEEDDDDEKEEAEVDEIEEVRMNADDERDDDYMAVADDKEDDHLNATPMMTVGKLLAKLKYELETYFQEKQHDMSLQLSLKKETEKKTLTEHQMLSLLTNIAKTVVESEDEEGDVLKVDKYVIIKTLDLMVFGLTGCDDSEALWMDMKNLARDKEISLSGLAQLVIELLDE